MSTATATAVLENESKVAPTIDKEDLIQREVNLLKSLLRDGTVTSPLTNEHIQYDTERFVRECYSAQRNQIQRWGGWRYLSPPQEAPSSVSVPDLCNALGNDNTTEDVAKELIASTDFDFTEATEYFHARTRDTLFRMQSSWEWRESGWEGSSSIVGKKALELFSEAFKSQQFCEDVITELHKEIFFSAENIPDAVLYPLVPLMGHALGFLTSTYGTGRQVLSGKYADQDFTLYVHDIIDIPSRDGYYMREDNSIWRSLQGNDLRNRYSEFGCPRWIALSIAARKNNFTELQEVIENHIKAMVEDLPFGGVFLKNNEWCAEFDSLLLNYKNTINAPVREFIRTLTSIGPISVRQGQATLKPILKALRKSGIFNKSKKYESHVNRVCEILGQMFSAKKEGRMMLSVSPSDFLRLGTLGESSCYRPHGEWEHSKFNLARSGSGAAVVGFTFLNKDNNDLLWKRLDTTVEEHTDIHDVYSRFWGMFLPDDGVCYTTNHYLGSEVVSYPIIRVAMPHAMNRPEGKAKDVELHFSSLEGVYLNDDNSAIVVPDAEGNTTDRLDLIFSDLRSDHYAYTDLITEPQTQCNVCDGSIDIDYDSYITCEDCGEPACENCYIECGCGGYYCRTCAESHGSQFCESCAEYQCEGSTCTSCHEFICENCASTEMNDCSDCSSKNKEKCKDCVGRKVCHDCGNDVCNDHNTLCTSCGYNYCGDCATKPNQCNDCEEYEADIADTESDSLSLAG